MRHLKSDGRAVLTAVWAENAQMRLKLCNIEPPIQRLSERHPRHQRGQISARQIKAKTKGKERKDQLNWRDGAPAIMPASSGSANMADIRVRADGK